MTANTRQIFGILEWSIKCNGYLWESRMLCMWLRRLHYSPIANLEIFLEEKGIKKGTAQFPFYSVAEFLLIYLDDICLFTPKGLDNANSLHLFLIEFLLYCTIKLGFKPAKNKVQLFPKSFKFVGHYFENDKNCTTIPPNKSEAL